MATWNPIKLTSMHYQHISLGATIAEVDGWQRPVRYTAPGQELEAVKKAVGICDISPVGKHSVQGNDITALIEKISPQVSALETNRVAVVNLSGPGGFVIDPVVVCRFCEDEVFITSPPDKIMLVAQTLEENFADCAHLVDMTSNFAAITVSGPSSSQMLSKLTDLNISPNAFPDLSCAQGMMAEVYVIIVRWDRLGLPGYDVYISREYGEYMWDAMLEAGHEYGIVPFGVETLKQLSRGE